MKKTLMILLSVIVILTAAIVGTQTASAATAGYLTYTVTDGKATITGCKTSASGELVIPDTLGGYPVTSIGDEAFYNCRSLTSIVIPGSVTSIGDSAFYNCRNLTSIEIPDGVTSIGRNAFYECRSLTSIEIPDGVTSIGDSAFSYCSILTSVEIPDGVTSIGNYAFSGCSSLTSVLIPASVTSIGNFAFYECSSLTGVYISDIAAWCGIEFGDPYSNPLMCAGILFLGDELVTELVIPDSVTSIGDYAFSGCDSLTSIVIPDSVTSIGNYAFSGCSSLTSVEIGDGVTSIGGYAFYECSSLTSVVIGGGVTSIGYFAFNECRSLTSIVIPDSVKSIGNYAFRGCSRLTSVEIGDSVTSIGDEAFYWCSSLTGVYISDIAAWCGIEFSDSFSNPLYHAENLYLNNELVTELVIPASVTSIGSYAFRNCSSLTSIEIPDSVTSIGDGAFSGCSLTSIVIPDSVTSIGGSAFSGCSRLTSVEIPDSVTSIGDYAFYNCRSLTSVEIPASVTSIGSYAFCECSSLTSIVIPDGVTSIGDKAFRDCSRLTSVEIGDGITSIGTNAFQDCSSLTGVYISDIAAWCGIEFSDSYSNPLYYAKNLYLNNELVTELVIPDSVTSIGDYAFSGCSSLTSVAIGDSVTSIGKNVFNNCNNVKYINIGLLDVSVLSGNLPKLTDVEVSEKSEVYSSFDGVVYNKKGSAIVFCPPEKTSVVLPETLTGIDDDDFANCSKLERITIPKSVTSISTKAFAKCKNVKIIGYNSSTAHIFAIKNKITFLNIVPPAAPEAPSLQSKTSDSVTLVSKTNYEYSLDGESWQTSSVFTGLDKQPEYKFYQRIGETTSSVPSEVSEPLTVKMDDSENTTEFGGGVGKVYSPYLVSTKEHLENVVKYPNAYFKQICDIKIADEALANNTVTSWEPIGDKNTPFNGVYDGNGYAILNLSVFSTKSTTFYGGVFGYSTGVIKNLTVKDSYIRIETYSTSQGYVGGIVGYVHYGTVSNCHNVNTKVKVTYAAMGYKVGGVAGYVDYGYLYECSNSGEVTGYISGGVVAAASTADIYGCYNTGSVDGYSAAGIVNSANNVEECYNTGTVTGSNQAAGIVESTSGSIKNCFNIGKITGDKAGGIVAEWGGNSILNCYNTGKIKGKYSTSQIGAIAGRIFSQGYSEVKNCYYTNNNEKAIGTIEVYSGATPKWDIPCITEAEMKNPESFEGFDFESVWTMSGHEEYLFPELKNVEMVYVAYVAGDLDGNEGIDSDDAIYLLYSVLFGEETYPIAQPVDFDGSGAVDSDDAIYLLYHVLFGEEAYPLK